MQQYIDLEVDQYVPLFTDTSNTNILVKLTVMIVLRHHNNCTINQVSNVDYHYGPAA